MAGVPYNMAGPKLNMAGDHVKSASGEHCMSPKQKKNTILYHGKRQEAS